MSKDLKIERICDHQILRELVEINTDMKTINIPRVLSSSDVEMYINGFKLSNI